MDWILFQHEIGSHDCVSEILYIDSNPKVVDLKSVTITKLEKHEFPKIWFPEGNGFVDVSHHKQEKIAGSVTDFHMFELIPTPTQPNNFNSLPVKTPDLPKPERSLKSQKIRFYPEWSLNPEIEESKFS